MGPAPAAASQSRTLRWIARHPAGAGGGPTSKSQAPEPHGEAGVQNHESGSEDLTDMFAPGLPAQLPSELHRDKSSPPSAAPPPPPLVLVVERSSLPAHLPVGAKVTVGVESCLLLGRDPSILQHLVRDASVTQPNLPLAFLPLRHCSVSREHALLCWGWKEGVGRWCVIDLRSHNGFLVAGRRVRPERRTPLYAQALLEVPDVAAFRVHLACPAHCYCHTGQGRVLETLAFGALPTAPRSAEAPVALVDPERVDAEDQADAFLAQIEEASELATRQLDEAPLLRVRPSHRARWQARNAAPSAPHQRDHRPTAPAPVLALGPELGEANKGNRMLRFMGWTPGSSLGPPSTPGITEPIHPPAQLSRQGLGHAATRRPK